MPKYDFSGKKALVTGAGQGIGRGTTLALLQSGAHVVAVSKTQENLDSLRRESGDHCAKLTIVQCDLQDTNNLHKTLAPYFPVDLLVNNAGIGFQESFENFSLANFDATFDVNFKAAAILMQILAKCSGEGKLPNGASVVNISSQASTVMLANHFAYTVSKAALDTATKFAAWELGCRNVRVNAVNPTVVMTAMGQKYWSDPVKAQPMLAKIPLGKFADTEDVVNAVMFLLSDDAKMITGACLPIDGGCSI